ncbi:hypothetical protein KCU62_g241, partial [Aureobasidium sp. EXF-3399]
LEVTAVEKLDDVLGKTSFVKGSHDLFSDGWCLRRRLDDDTVAGEESGNDRVDKSEVRVLEMREENKNRAQRHLANETPEAFLGLTRSTRHEQRLSSPRQPCRRLVVPSVRAFLT